MRKLAIILAILAQAAALGWVVIERETVLRNGTVVYLRTAPVDPRDVFRGDYVTLTYDINRIPQALVDAPLLAQLQPQPQQQIQRKELRVYASLTVGAQGIAEISALHAQPPAGGLYLRGYTTQDWQLLGNNQEVSVRFGIEKLFVEQGAGKLIEQQRGSRNDWQTPMEVAVAVGGNGIGVIRDHRWSPLATRLEVLPPPQGTPRDALISPRLSFSIRNDSAAPLALAAPGNDCRYVLTPVDGQAITLLNDDCADAQVVADDVVVLAPGESFVHDLDLAKPHWHVRMTAGDQETFRGELGHFAGWQRFRMIYRSPANAAALSTATAPVWTGNLSSAAFSNRGRID